MKLELSAPCAPFLQAVLELPSLMTRPPHKYHGSLSERLCMNRRTQPWRVLQKSSFRTDRIIHIPVGLKQLGASLQVNRNTPATFLPVCNWRGIRLFDDCTPEALSNSCPNAAISLVSGTIMRSERFGINMAAANLNLTCKQTTRFKPANSRAGCECFNSLHCYLKWQRCFF